MKRNDKSLFEKENSVKSKVAKKERGYSQTSVTMNNEDLSILKRLKESKGIDISTLLVGGLGFIIKKGLLKEFLVYIKSLGYVGLYVNKENRFNKSLEGRPSFLTGNKTLVDSFVKDVEGGGLIVLKELIKFKTSTNSKDRQLFYQYNRNGSLNLLRIYDVRFFINNKEFKPEKEVEFYKVLLNRKVSEIKINVKFEDGGIQFLDGGNRIYSSGKVSLSSLRRTLTDKDGIPHTIDGLLEDIKTFVYVNPDYILAYKSDNAIRCLSNYHPKRNTKKEFIDICKSFDSSDSFIRKVIVYYDYYKSI